MPHKLRRIRKKRGSRTHGYGRVGQHRSSGCKGMRKAGRHKHGWSYTIRYEPNYFGKRGFTSPKSLKRRLKIMNVGRLDQLAEKLSEEKRKGKLFIDLESLGYTKLLGTGKVTKPLIVKIGAYSKSAAEKIEEAGGQILMKSQEQER